MAEGCDVLSAKKGAVAFDVDGVLLRQQFLWRASLRAGPLIFLKSLWLGFLFKAGRLSVHEVVERLYALHAGRTVAELVGLAQEVEFASGARDVIEELRRRGYRVILLSAGVPQPAVEVLGKRLGADEAYGTLLEERGGRLTGRVLGNRHSPHGKLEVLSKVLRRDGLVWDDTTVVVDDRSNAEIVAAAGTSIGVNPELPVLRDAQFVMPCVDLTEVLDFVPGSATSQASARSRELTHELVRKAVHICGVAVPALAAWSKPFTLILIAVVTGLYALSEALRQLGLALPPVSTITRWAMRKAEARGIVKGPILYGAGIWLTVALFGPAPATAGVLTFAVGDGAASLVGSSIGRIPLPHSRGKTLEGSLAVLLAGVFIAIFFVSWPWAIVVGVVASLVESLPIGDFDNLFLPLACAGVVVLARRIG